MSAGTARSAIAVRLALAVTTAYTLKAAAPRPSDGRREREVKGPSMVWQCSAWRHGITGIAAAPRQQESKSRPEMLLYPLPSRFRRLGESGPVGGGRTGEGRWWVVYTTCILRVYYVYTPCILRVYFVYTSCILPTTNLSLAQQLGLGSGGPLLEDLGVRGKGERQVSPG